MTLVQLTRGQEQDIAQHLRNQREQIAATKELTRAVLTLAAATMFTGTRGTDMEDVALRTVELGSAIAEQLLIVEPKSNG